MTTVEVLRAAREKLAKPGVWAKGAKVGLNGCACALTATEWAAGRTGSWLTAAEDNADHFVRDAVGVRRQSEVAAWNDAPERTLEEVLAAFDRAIALAEAQ